MSSLKPWSYDLFTKIEFIKLHIYSFKTSILVVSHNFEDFENNMNSLKYLAKTAPGL